MLLIGCSLALLVIYAGMKLMAQTEKENLGKMYKYVSMFLVVMGFLMISGAACCGIMRCCHRGHEMMERKERMMEERCFGNSCMGGQMGHHNMMFRQRMNMEGCCEGMMMNGSCGMMMRGGGCEGEMNGCHGKMMGKCRGDNEECDEESDECPMKKGECKKDSVVKIIKKK
ncbi:MAG TPA: hypothetical protein VN026_10005 [Bacteroidia bacterium]|jgi:hypothetical protein|nr:hypothetical protein [Bacteroidia bacterium]